MRLFDKEHFPPFLGIFAEIGFCIYIKICIITLMISECVFLNRLRQLYIKKSRTKF